MSMNSSRLITRGYCPIKFEPLKGKDWQTVLDSGIKVMEEMGFKVQIGSGNLLGLVREKDGYIHHDTDLDLDVFIKPGEEEKTIKLVDEITKQLHLKGFKLAITNTYNDGKPMQMAYIHGR